MSLKGIEYVADDPHGAVELEATGRAKRRRDGAVEVALKRGSWELTVVVPPAKGRANGYSPPRGEFEATVKTWLHEDGETLSIDLDDGRNLSFIDVPVDERDERLKGDLDTLLDEIRKSEAAAA
ncbi:MAG: hypothetical protein E6G45_11410 [Actinobacteria bacterium]|nr:MAG: hypothetical protein E6G45_11410 [Actinomycetota bacterium]